MNPPSVEPRVRPFAFNPANIQAPPDSVRPLNLSNARPKSSYPAHQNFTSSTTAFQPQKLWQNSKKQAKTNESNLIHLSSVNQKSPVSKRKRQEYKSSPQYIRPQPIHQSLNVDNHPQISNKQNKTKPPSPEVDILIQDIDDDNDDTEDLVDADMLLGGSKEDAKKTAITKEQNSRPRSQSPTLFDFDPLLESKTAISTIQEAQKSVTRLAQEGVKLIEDMEDLISRYQHAIDVAARFQIQKRNNIHKKWENAKDNAQQLLDTVRDSVPH